MKFATPRSVRSTTELLKAGSRLVKTVFPLTVVLLAFVSVGMVCQAQDMGTGSLSVTVSDAGGALIPGAKLVLIDPSTNDTHTVETKSDGAIVIPFLNPANYSLTVTKEGFASTQYGNVRITTNQTTNLAVSLKVGAATETVTVSSDRSPILNTTSNTLSTTLDMKQVQDLPTSARSVSALAFLVPGAVDDNFNNLPGGAENYSANGFSTMNDRNKSGGFDATGTATTQRLESTQEITVQTGELDASKGGTSAMDIGFLTKRGTNQFHGQLFEDYRSEALNANSWANNFAHQKRGLLIINDFGFSLGGPLLKDRLFFFASLGNYRQPTQSLVQTTIPTPLALSGIYTYFPCQNGTSGNGCVTNSNITSTVNVLNAGASAGCSTCTNQINPLVASVITNALKSVGSAGNTITAASDPNHEIDNFQHHSSTIRRYPTLRMDYNLTHNFRLTGVGVGTFSYGVNTGNPAYSDQEFAHLSTSSKGRNYQAVVGFDWTVKPNIVNAFRVGYLYAVNFYNANGPSVPTDAMIAQGTYTAGFGLNTGINNGILLGGSFYPTYNVKDDTTWSHGKHTISFGVEWTTEPDHYYNNQFVPGFSFNQIRAGDPVQSALDASVANGTNAAKTDVEALYATLTGRISSYSYGQFVNYKTKVFDPKVAFDLHEKLTNSALFVQDSWKATPTLTVNAGLRWNFAGASKDQTGFYTHPSISDLWGPSGEGNLFKPGTLTGNFNAVQSAHPYAYDATYVHPQPTVGFAWNPRFDSENGLGRIFGNGKSVIRGSFTLKNYIEGTQNFWNFGSNSGYNFNTTYRLTAQAPNGATPPVGFYNAGSLSLGDALPPVSSSSAIPYQSTITEESLAFPGNDILTFDPHIKQPYVESWQFGIQRQLSTNQVIEVRYVGNVGKDGWFAKNYNEVNIFENGFLDQFKQAQANLAASPGGNSSFQGPGIPILDQAFKTSNQYKNATFIQDLQQGSVGAFAQSLASSTTYLCSLVGANFQPCHDKNIPGTGTYPINLFEANPYVTGSQISEMGNYASSNYNALQVEFRQNPTHGAQFDVNYTFAKGLGVGEQGSTAAGYYGGRSNSAGGFFTLRNPALNYFPSSFDVRHVVHGSGTYDLPFGHGRQFMNQNAIANAVVGGWTIGTIVSWQTGEPHLLSGGNATFNQFDGGIQLHGITASDLQHSIRPRHVAGKNYVQMLDSKYIQPSGQGANPAYITPNFTPGTIGQLVWLHSPANFNTDLSLTKLVPVYREINLKLQGEFFNAFNHVSWTGFTTGVTSTTFGTSTSLFAGARQIELRANIQF